MIIELIKEQEAQLNALVQTGKFSSAEQFISYSLSIASEDAEHTDWLRAEALKGLEGLDAGRYSDKTTEEIADKGARQLNSQRP